MTASDDYDMSKTIAPKSDQLNADDLVAGPITVRILEVKKSGDDTHPFFFHLEGFKGRPWKPCKTQRRLVVQLWGGDVRKYAGRTVQLYRNPKVRYGGEEVGGIQVAALSDIEQDTWVVVSESKNKRTQHLVKRLDVQSKPATETKPPGNIEQALRMIAGTDKTTIEHVLAKLREFAWTKDESRAIKEAADNVKAKSIAVDVGVTDDYDADYGHDEMGKPL